MRQIKEKDKVWGKQGRALGCTLRLCRLGLEWLTPGPVVTSVLSREESRAHGSLGRGPENETVLGNRSRVTSGNCQAGVCVSSLVSVTTVAIYYQTRLITARTWECFTHRRERARG